MSWHLKDWLKLGGLLGLGATGLGAAGVGPMAGLLAASTAPQAGALAGTGAADAGLLGMTGASSAPGAGAYELATVGDAAGMGAVTPPPTSIPNAMQGLLGKAATNAQGPAGARLAANVGLNMIRPPQAPQIRPLGAMPQQPVPVPPQAGLSPDQMRVAGQGQGGMGGLDISKLPPEVLAMLKQRGLI